MYFAFFLLLRECHVDLKEGIASLIFAAPRCSEIPELGNLKNIFEKKYRKAFVSAATELRPSCGVNRMLIDKLSVKHQGGEFKLKIMKEIAKEFAEQEFNAIKRRSCNGQKCFCIVAGELESVRIEYANAQLECNAAYERSKILASEVISLEDKGMKQIWSKKQLVEA